MPIRDVFMAVLILFLCTCWLLVLIYQSASLLSRFRYQKQVVSNAPELSGAASVGDYVKAMGVVKNQTQQSPYLDLTCCYWDVVIRAEYHERGQKMSGGQGYQYRTYNKVIFEQSFEQALEFEHNGLLVEVDFSDIASATRQFDCELKTVQYLPDSPARLHARPHHQRFHIEEKYLPRNCLVTVWAEVKAMNDNKIILSEAKDPWKVSCISKGDVAVLNIDYKNRINFAWLCFIWQLSSFVGLWMIPILALSDGVYFIAVFSVICGQMLQWFRPGE